MAVNPDIVGREYPPESVYEVSREKIAEFATAIGSTDPAHFDGDAARALGHPDVIAPPTFAVVIAQRSEARVIRDPEAGIDYSRVVHGEEKFVHRRPITVGDVLVTTSYVDSVRSAGGHSMVSTRSEIATQGGEPVSTVTSTIVVRGGE
ncbi:MAG: MaoC family dehydratase N-terminal domain-containing protein [Actinobacteria bacterium]|nr:MaoC family dehydratase N-terminal domain-containing protein [Actinomycetota bacterium]